MTCRGTDLAAPADVRDPGVFMPYLLAADVLLREHGQKVLNIQDLIPLGFLSVGPAHEQYFPSQVEP